ncbi:MAG: circularly permuted type 2 ATP-grasp protein [Planctomycetota bacterium]
MDASAGGSSFHERTTSDGNVRPHWLRFSDGVDALGAGALRDCADSIEQFIRENGVTFHAHSQDAPSRPWKISAIPFVVSDYEWNQISSGLIQRTRLLERILQDLLGPQQLIRERVVPGKLLWANPHFRRPYHQLGGEAPKLHLTAADLARASDGRWRVVSDRTRAPSGLGYLLENRIVSSRAMQTLMRQNNTLRLASFFEALQQHLRSLAISNRENPRVALLTPPRGSYREFEDTYLARYLGLTLVQGSDLAVRDGHLHLKTLGGLKPIQVLWRHISDRQCDPLELDPSSTSGITGLLGCVRRRSVSVVNAIGSVLAQTPALMPYLDAAQRFFDGDELALTSYQTFWCGDPNHLTYVLSDVDRFIFRDAMAVTRSLPSRTGAMSRDDRDAFLAKLNAQPEYYVAQEVSPYSQTPVYIDGTVCSRKVSLRAFQLSTNEGTFVLPGALARVGRDELELSHSPVSGQMTLDVWVTSDDPVDQHKTLLPDSDSPVELLRGGGELPSRVAEHFFWLGRYAERTEFLSRTMRTSLVRVAGEGSGEDHPEIQRLVYALASMGQIEASFALESFVANLPQLEETLPASVLDGEQPGGLIQVTQRMLTNATAVRDRLSVDAFRIIQRAQRDLMRPVIGANHSQEAKIGLSEAIERLGTLITDLQALAGVACESIVRTHAWQFLELGRRIERAEKTCELLSTMLCPATKHGNAMSLAVLDTTDSSMTYRSRYMNLVRLAAVVDLLVTDETNPRSIRFQLDRIEELLNELPTVDAPVGLNTIERLVLDSLYAIKTADPIELANPGGEGSLDQLETLLQLINRKLPELATRVSERYLIHTDPPIVITGSDRSE